MDLVWKVTQRHVLEKLLVTEYERRVKDLRHRTHICNGIPRDQNFLGVDLNCFKSFKVW